MEGEFHSVFRISFRFLRRVNSGGFMGDLVFNGGNESTFLVIRMPPQPRLTILIGKFGIWGGNQQLVNF
jgi:hypothetical protein